VSRGSSRPFVPGRIVGGSVIAERDPFSVDAMLRFRGLEIVDAGEPVAPPELERGPYRMAAPGVPCVRRVVIYQGHAQLEDERPFHELFHALAAELWALAGSPMPRLLHAFGRDGRVHAVVMEALEGLALDRLVEEIGRMRERMPVAVALAIAHAVVPLWPIAGDVQVHVGLGDVVLTRAGHVRVLPRLASAEARHVVGTTVGILEGPVLYKAPEQLYKDEHTQQSAMYGLGMLLYEMLVGGVQRALGLGSSWELLSRVHQDSLPRVETLRGGLALHVAGFVARALAREPGDRFASWHELSACLAAVRSSFAPVGPEELAGWVRSLPSDLHGEDAPLPDVATLGDWRRLPHAGLVPVPWPSPSEGRSGNKAGP
jgi:hypothetical protein